MSSFKGANDQITNSWKILQLQWATTNQQWNDAVSAQFEQSILSELETAVQDILQSSWG